MGVLGADVLLFVCSGVMYWCDLLEAELSLPGGFHTRFLARSSAKSRSRGGSNRYLDV